MPRKVRKITISTTQVDVKQAAHEHNMKMLNKHQEVMKKYAERVKTVAEKTLELLNELDSIQKEMQEECPTAHYCNTTFFHNAFEGMKQHAQAKMELH